MRYSDGCAALEKGPSNEPDTKEIEVNEGNLLRVAAWSQFNEDMM
jgi:hypothetical protein